MVLSVSRLAELAEDVNQKVKRRSEDDVFEFERIDTI